MGRIRSIKPEFWSSVPVSYCSRSSRLLLISLWNHADDDGRMVDEPKLIKAACFPLDDDVSGDTINTWLDELWSRQRIVRYEFEGRKYIAVNNFREHQRPQKPIPSKLPAPPASPHYPTATVVAQEDYRTPTVVLSSVVGVGVGVGVVGEFPEPSGSGAQRVKTTQRTGSQFPSFTREMCDAGYEMWLSRSGATDYAFFRKCFGPIFARPESERPANWPRDDEFVPGIKLYLAAVSGTSEAKFATPKKCAESLTRVVQAMREGDTSERRLDLAQFAIGVTQPGKRLEGKAA